MNRDNAQPLIGIVLCVLFFLGYEQYITRKYPRPAQPAADVASTSVAQPPSTAAAPLTTAAVGTAPVATVAALSSADLTLENELVSIRFIQDLGAVESVKLKGYARELGGEERVELLEGPMVLRGLPAPQYKVSAPLLSASRQAGTLRFVRSVGPWVVEESYTLAAGSYELQVGLKYSHSSPELLELEPTLWAGEQLQLASAGSSFIPRSGPPQQRLVAGLGSSVKTAELEKHCKDPQEALVFAAASEQVDFAGIDMHYFLSVLRPKFPKAELRVEAQQGQGPGCGVNVMLGQKYGKVPAGETVALEFTSYFGPKDFEVLEGVNKTLAKTVDFGWFRIFAYPLLLVVRAVERVAHNYGIAIIVVTALLKLLFYPLTKAASVSMKRMQKMQPEMQRLREKYASEPQKQQQELLRFMSTNKVNPAKGCLPILPQIPVFIAFYNVLSQAIELRHASFALWIHDLAAADPYYVSPIALGGLMFVQQRLTPSPGLDKAQARIMMMMPVLFTVMMLSLPAGMVIYMITNTIISIAQQQWLNRKLA